ncbi:hypothetical protein H8E06_00665 [bacterium]|nr:hypothetical protein [bacterium]
MSSILKSLGITFTISISIGALFYFSTGNFIGPFVISSVVQFILFFVWNSAMEIWRDHLRRQTDNEMYKQLSKMGLDVECNYCGELAFAPVDLSTENRYKCTKCNKDNRILIEVRTVQTTEIPESLDAQQALKNTANE